MKDGSWWAVFLASRPYTGFRYNTGRETFLLPVTWKDGWPVILEHGKAIPYTLPGRAPWRGRVAPCGRAVRQFHASATNSTARSGPEWLQVHVPKTSRFEVRERRAARCTPLPVNLDEKRNASFLARRQQHLNFDAITALGIRPPRGGVAAGLAAYQNENYWYFFGTRRVGSGLQVFLERNAGKGAQIVTGMSHRRAAVTAAAHQRGRPQLLFLSTTPARDGRRCVKTTMARS